jgi:hypothetical protein
LAGSVGSLLVASSLHIQREKAEAWVKRRKNVKKEKKGQEIKEREKERRKENRKNKLSIF